MTTALKYRALIDGTVTGGNTEAASDTEALAFFAALYEAIDAGDGRYLTAAGEEVTAVRQVPRLEVITIDGEGRTQSEAREMLHVPEGECLGCFLGDADPYLHSFGEECGS